MKIKIRNIKIEVEWIIIIVFFASIFSHVIRKYLSMYYICYLCIIFHELSHVVIGVVLKKELRGIKFSTCGMNANFKKRYIENTKLDNIKDVVIYLSGPIASFIFAIAFKKVTFLHEINLFFCILNLIPIYPLDGYNILKSCILIISGNKKVFASKLSKVVSMLTLVILSIGLVMLCIKTNNYSPIVFLAYLISLNITR